MSATDNPMTMPALGGAVEVEISLDIAKRGVFVAPVMVAIAGLIWGIEGVYSAALAVGLVVVNFLLSAFMVSTAAKISVGAMLGAIIFGYLVRLGLIVVAIMLVSDVGWISIPALGAAIIVTHLGLLLWELKYVSLTLAYPGLKPAIPSTRNEKRTD